MNRKRAVIHFAVFLLLYIAAGCATKNSNTRSAKEHSSLTVRAATTSDVVDQAIGMEAIVAVVTDLGIKAAKAAIKAEAKKYEASSSAAISMSLAGIKPREGLLSQGYQMDSGAYFVFLRTFETGETNGYLRRFDQSDRSVHAAEIHRILQPHLSAPPTITDIVDILSRETHTTRTQALSFCAVGLIRQRPSHQSFELQLLGYTYPALKAKNSRFQVPFTKWHRSESKLSLQVEGPQGADLGGGKGLSAGGFFDVKWDRKTAIHSNTPPGWIAKPDAPDPKKRVLARSKPIVVPPFQDLVFSATLTESSDMKKTLEKAAELVDKLKDD